MRYAGFLIPPRALIGLTTAVVLLLYAAPLLLSAPLTDPDEGLHAAIAQEMHERGEIVVPSFLGEPFRDKPILFFWTQLASLAVFGMSEAAVRLPGFAFAILGILTTGWLAATLFGRRGGTSRLRQGSGEARQSAEGATAAVQPESDDGATNTPAFPKATAGRRGHEGSIGWIAAACYGTLAVPFALAQAPVHDVALVPMVNVGLIALWNMEARQRERRAMAVWTLVAGIALGGSILTKGLTGIAIAGLAYGAMLLACRRLTPRLIVGGCAALAIAAALAAPWYASMEAREPGYLAYYFGARHVLGLVGDSQPHGDQPWWFYLPVLGAGSLPWVLYISPGHARLTTHRPATVLLWCWCIASFILLTTAGSKLVTYALPVFPAVAIMAAYSWSRALADPTAGGPSLRSRVRWHALVFAIAAAAFPWAAGQVGETAVSPLGWIVLVLLSGCWLWLCVFPREPSPRLWLGVTVGTATTYAAALFLLAPAIAHAHSGRDLALHLNESTAMPANMLVVGDRVGSMVFYLRPDLRRALTASSLRSVAPSAAGSLAASAQLIAAPAGLRARLVDDLSDWIGSETVAGRYVIFRPRNDIGDR
jgi:4-amino-4-deoxy-L-arabinose transferase-like glycosyltransferase